MKRPALLLLLGFLLMTLISCKDQESHTLITDLRAQYDEHSCCANLSLLDNSTISTFDQSRQDFLLYAVNMNKFVDREELQLGDPVRLNIQILELPLKEELAYSCNSICNRHNGIPVKVLQLKKD